jgi:tRNA-2-methylthio-N6-dimethylallyladenosine synthase
MPKRFYIQTVGCQMNILDSELVAAQLLGAGYELANSPRQADTILLNTCSVRQHAEDKIYSALGRLKELKEKHPQKIIGVLGCMAQKDQGHILQRAPYVDLVVGPGQLGRLPALLAEVAAGGGPRIEVSLDRTAGSRQSVQQSFARFQPTRPAKTRSAPHQAMVRVMFGCDKFCTYCIVPRVRGPEQSRPAVEIREEVRRLADDGCREVTLLGQTVNSYQDTTGPSAIRLADLLAMLHDVEGIRRLKFVTNYPKHMSDDLLQAMRDLPKVSPYLHVPAQSGSNAVLQRMKRGYSVESYREMLQRIRAVLPEAAITSDFIVGFCGETEDEFQQTVDLVRDARFKNSFIFKYSARPGTKAAEVYTDDVPEAVKRRRNNELLAVQNAICLEDNQPLLGRTVEILVEGPSKVAKHRDRVGGSAMAADGAAVDGPHPNPLPKGEGTTCAHPSPLLKSEGTTCAYDEFLPEGERRRTQLVGRTTCDRIVVFDGPPELIGQIMPIVIEKVDAFTLFGKANITE